MKEIEIEDDLYKYILSKIEAFGETPSQILRRLLLLPAIANNNDIEAACYSELDIIKKTSGQKTISSMNKEASQLPLHSTADTSSPDNMAASIEALFTRSSFITEAIITKKFNMMLMTMYHEKKAAFIVAANTTKGRTRDYFGQNLSELLASDNNKEVALLRASKPRNIPNTPFWVITNANTRRKQIILRQMMTSMGYPEYLIARIPEHLAERTKDEI
ncbi:replication initiation regulator SeqA [Psychromonas antarctica]|uniref:replication initiation regulator SeqA n=1 Tax=Psychromonas antarctica TaxID=67573 RepID=UPI001EE8EEFB|nr:replication initiation regulator SeqA [Psychromonas antarctica]MCG6201959.1 replication initiation regulator SeqA [Psychromonas antarctica]